MDTATDPEGWLLGITTGARPSDPTLRGFERSGNPETDAGIAAYLGDLYEGGHSAAVAAMARLRYGR